MADFDVIVLGGGPGGYVAAIRCARLGLKPACIDDRVNEQGKPSLGGVCLNIGCIPSKALLDTSHHFYRAQHEFSAHGIQTGSVEIDVATMQQRKQQVVQTLTGGIAMLFVKHKITHLKGRGTLLVDRRVRVAYPDQSQNAEEFSTEHIIIATGSSPVALADVPFDGKRIVDSTGALDFDAVPKRLGIIGGGVIGLELGSVWSRLGAKTTMLVRGEKFLASADQQVARAVQKDLGDEGMDIRLGARLMAAKKGAKLITLSYTDADGEHKLQVDRLLVAAGRRPNTANIGAEAIGLKLDARGFIDVDAECRTPLPNVYAIGDVVRGPMLAHKASEEGAAVAERIAGQQPEVNFNTIPFVIYTWPEIALVGRSSEQLQADGVEFNSGVFPFLASGRAHAAGDINWF